jgi:hypothetical protein
MKKFALVLLWFATIWAATWFGGQLFNALMVVPHFSRNPPESLTAWGEMRFDNLAVFLSCSRRFGRFWRCSSLFSWLEKNRLGGGFSSVAAPRLCA